MIFLNRINIKIFVGTMSLSMSMSYTLLNKSSQTKS